MSGSTDPDPARFEPHIAAFEKWDAENAFPRDGILFVGSSSINFWQTTVSFPDLPVINRGFGGAHIPDLNHYFDRIVPKYKPRVIVYYCGDNDVAFGSPPEKVFNDFQLFAGHVHDALPEAKFIYIAIKPSPSRWKLWPEMQTINAHVKQYAKNKNWMTYIDTASALLGANGEPRKELFRDDNLHLNETGYKVWADILGPRLHTMLHQPAAHASTASTSR